MQWLKTIPKRGDSWLAWIIHKIYPAWCKSLKLIEVGREQVDVLLQKKTPFVVCLWHGEFFPLIYLYYRKQERGTIIVSHSRDGRFMGFVLGRMGFNVVRGSSSRGGAAALFGVSKKVENGAFVCITVDGPRGPIYKVKKGAIFLAQHENIPVVPVRVFMDHAKSFNSWDKFLLPLPFSRVKIIWGDPYFIESVDSKEAIQNECRILEDKMNSLAQLR